MSLIFSRRPSTDTWQYRPAFGVRDIFGIGIAILDRGDELICISPNKGEHPIDVSQVRSAKANRDRNLAHGIPCAPLQTLED